MKESETGKKHCMGNCNVKYRHVGFFEMLMHLRIAETKLVWMST